MSKNTKAAYRNKMPIELRAKQFMPFAAVTGLEKALRAKEKEVEEEAEHQVELEIYHED